VSAPFEVDTLRVEVERLRAALADAAWTAADVDQSLRVRLGVVTHLRHERDTLRVEVDRLRAALDAVRAVRNSVDKIYPDNGRPVRLANVVEALDRALAAAGVPE
jgi:hypothetical protein